MPFWHIYSRLKNPVQNRGEKWKNEKVNFHKVSKKDFFSCFYQSVGTSRWVSRQEKKIGFFLLKSITFGFVDILQAASI